jgi:putative salt-induced outer membrane protein YdiY
LYVPRSRSLLLFLALSTAALADQVTLKNGDRLSGVIVKSDTKELTLKSEFAGTVKISWGAIETITATAPLYVHLTSGDTLAGSVTTTDGQIRVATANLGAVATTKDKIKALVSKEEEAAYEKEIERLRNPSLLDLWTGFVDTGLSMARGNSNSTTFSVGMNAARVTPRDKITAYFTSLYSKNKTRGVTVVGAQADRGGLRYDANFAGRNFAFGSVDLEYDKFQNLDLRGVFGGGAGRHVIKTETTVLDLFGGGALNKEFFSNGVSRTSGEVQLGDLLNYKVNKSFSITQSLVFFPNVSETGEYRMNFDLAAVTTLKRWLGWHVTVSDRYLSNPILAGIKKNDLLLTTGFRISFAK